MVAKQESKLTPFEQAKEVREELTSRVDIAKQAEMVIPPWLAAVLTGFPTQILEQTGILMVVDEREAKIIVSKDRYFLLEKAFAWASEDEETQDRVLVGLYGALFQIGQASMAPGVEAAQIIRPHRTLIELHANQFPPLRNLGEFIEGGGELDDLDKENIGGILTYIFYRLKAAGNPQVRKWESGGLTPDNAFNIPGE